ncbi:MAG: PAS domain S-box protein [bacterium]|nr:PAS domain S-box protein [bacterium]
MTQTEQIARLMAEIERLTEKIAHLEGHDWLTSFPRENPAPILACATDGTVVYTNPAALRVVESLGLDDPRDILPENHLQIIRASLATPCALTAVRRVDSHEFEWSYHSAPPQNICYLFAQDVVDRRRTETALRESESWFRAVVDNLNEGLLVTDLDERIIYANNRIAEMCGSMPEELVGTAAELLWPEELRAEVAHRTTQRHAGACDRYETQILHRSGRRIWVKVSAAPYRDTNGNVTGCFGILTDISDLKNAEEEREKLEAQVRRTQKLETIGTLAGGIAHDFNNILTPILGYSDMARLDASSGTMARTCIEHVIQAAHRAKDLVKQILMFSRQGEEERKPLQLHPIIKEALKLLRASIPKTIEIRETIHSGCEAVLADPSQIHQVLMNLCTNAFHAMRDRGGVLEVSLSPITVDETLAQTRPNLHAGRYVRLTVGDTGNGMTHEVIDRIFEPFFTTKDVGEGTGLGLSVVHGIVTKHGGDITVYSEPGHGTVFHVYLPVAENVSLADDDVEEPLAAGHEHVLYVDDDAEIAEMAKLMLERLGYTVTIRSSSVEALEAFRAAPERYDVVITDQTMPRLTGTRLAGEMHAIRPDLPVILTTGFSETISSETFGRHAIRAFVMKPIVMRDLSVALRRVLDSPPTA